MNFKKTIVSNVSYLDFELSLMLPRTKTEEPKQQIIEHPKKKTKLD